MGKPRTAAARPIPAPALAAGAVDQLDSIRIRVLHKTEK
jgi:hypothetical protein